MARGQRARRARLLGLRVLDVLRLVEDDGGPGHAAEVLEVAQQQGVAGDDEAVPAGRLAEGLSLSPAHAVMDERGQVGREPLGLALPVADDRGRAHHERGAVTIRRSLGEQLGQGLHRLAEPHVVGDHAAQAQPRIAPQPGVAALLIRPQRGLQLRRGRPLLEAGVALEPAEDLGDRTLGLYPLDG